MTDINLALFASKNDNVPKPTTCDLLATLEQEGFTIREEKDGDAYAPATFVPGGVRRKDDVLSVNLIVFDVDENGPIDRDAITKELDEIGVRYLLHTTHSHGAIDPKTNAPKDAYRLLIGCSQPIPAHLWPAVRAEAVKVFGNKHVSAISSDASRLYFAPACPPERANLAWMHSNLAGEDVDPLSLLTDAQRAAPAPAVVARPVGQVEWVLGETFDIEPLAVVSGSTTCGHYAKIVAIHECDVAAFPDGHRYENVRLAINDIVWKMPDISEASVIRFCTPFVAQLRAVAPKTKVSLGLVRDFYQQAREDLNKTRAVEKAQLDRLREAIVRANRNATDEESLFRAMIARHTMLLPASEINEPAFEMEEGDAVDVPATFTDDEMKAMEKHAGIDHIISEEYRREELVHRLVMINAMSEKHWVLTPNGYVGPVGPKALLPMMMRELLRLDVEKFPEYSRSMRTGNKAQTPLTYADIALKHFFTVMEVNSSMMTKHTYYDNVNKELVRAHSPMRDLHPLYNARVETWLELLGGAKKDKLLDWLATADQLDKPTAALYLVGEAGCGKSMLMHGLARIWGTQGPGNAMDALSSGFNASGLKPIIAADEGLQKPKNGESYSGMLRNLVGNTMHHARRKYLDGEILTGCPRFIIAANNNRSLSDLMHKEERGEEDIEAIAIRILLIECDRRAADYLKEIGGRSGTAGWVDGDVIARHLRWLQTTRGPKVVHGDRFIVHGDKSDMVKLLTVTGVNEATVLEWVSGAIKNINIIKSELTGKTPPIVIGNGRILVQSAFISKRLQAYVPDGRMSVHVVGRTLSNLSRTKGARAKYKNVHYYELDVEHVKTWGIDNDGVKAEDFDLIVNKPLAGEE